MPTTGHLLIVYELRKRSTKAASRDGDQTSLAVGQKTVMYIY